MRIVDVRRAMDGVVEDVPMVGIDAASLVVLDSARDVHTVVLSHMLQFVEAELLCLVAEILARQMAELARADAARTLEDDAFDKSYMRLTNEFYERLDDLVDRVPMREVNDEVWRAVKIDVVPDADALNGGRAFRPDETQPAQRVVQKEDDTLARADIVDARFAADTLHIEDTAERANEVAHMDCGFLEL